MPDVAPRIAPAEDETERAIAQNSLQHVGKKNAKRRARHAETTDKPEIRSERDHTSDDRVQQVQPRLLHHDHGFGETDERVRRAGDRDNAEPHSTLAKRRAVDAENKGTGEDYHRDDR